MHVGVCEAINQCRGTGVAVKMCHTSDNILTAHSIVIQCSIYTVQHSLACLLSTDMSDPLVTVELDDIHANLHQEMEQSSGGYTQLLLMQNQVHASFSHSIVHWMLLLKLCTDFLH